MEKGLVTSILKSQEYLLENSKTRGGEDRTTTALKGKIYFLRNLLSKSKKPFKLKNDTYFDYLAKE